MSKEGILNHSPHKTLNILLSVTSVTRAFPVAFKHPFILVSKWHP